MLSEALAQWDKEYEAGRINLDKEPFSREVSCGNGSIMFFHTKSREGRLRPITQSVPNSCWLDKAETIKGFPESEFRVAFNTFPYKKGSLLLISPEHRVSFKKEDLRAWFDLEAQLEQEANSFRPYLFWNIRGAGASLDHLHAQVVFIEKDVNLLAEVAQKKSLAEAVSELEYPMFCLSVAGSSAMETVERAYGLIGAIAQDFGTVYNIGISHGEIRIFPRATPDRSEIAQPMLTLCQNKALYTDKISGSEVNGLYSTTNAEVAQILKTRPDKELINLFSASLKEISFDEEQRKRLIDTIKS